MRWCFGQKIINFIRYGKNYSGVYSDELKSAIDKYNQKRYSNILVENTAPDNRKTAIYFSGNDVFYPMDMMNFTKKIKKKNFYQFYRTRYNFASQHIFLRDIKYLWYQYGINNEYNSPDKVADLLKEITKGREIYTFGGSSGGFAAILFGILIGAKFVVVSDPQIDFQLMLKNQFDKNEYAEHYGNQIYQNILSERFKYGNLQTLIENSNTKLYIISSENSWVDVPQIELIKNYENIHYLYNNYSEHGLFGSKIFSDIIKLSEQELDLLFLNKRYSSKEEVAEAIASNKAMLESASLQIG